MNTDFNILANRFLRDEELERMALGILTGTLIADFVDTGKVQIILTDEERVEYLAAIIKAQQSFWFWRKDIASHLSPELEALVCGHRPERYIKIR